MVGAHSPSQVKTRRRTWATATILTRLSTGLGRRHARFSLAETPLTSQSPTLGSPFQKTRFPKDSMSTLTGALSVTNKMSRGRESNERSSLYDNSPPYYHRIRSVRVDDSHSLLGARLRLVAFESTTRQGTAPFMATGLCNYWTHRSERPIVAKARIGPSDALLGQWARWVDLTFFIAAPCVLAEKGAARWCLLSSSILLFVVCFLISLSP